MERSKNILITGCNGQLGSEIHDIVEQFPNFNFVFTDYQELDITNKAAVETFFSDVNPDYVVNCAAYTAVDKAETDEDKALLLNGVAPGILAYACKQAGAKLIHVSTDYVFNGVNHTPYVETDAVCPVSAYGRTKLVGEQNAMEQGVTMVIRTAWLYSSHGNNFVKTMLRLSATKPEIGVVSDQVGTPTYAGDLAQAILKIIDSDKFVPEIFHFTNEGVCSWYDFAHEIIKKSGNSCIVKPITTAEFASPTVRPCYSILSKKKIRDTYNLQIPHWRDSLNICLSLLK